MITTSVDSCIAKNPSFPAPTINYVEYDDTGCDDVQKGSDENIGTTAKLFLTGTDTCVQQVAKKIGESSFASMTKMSS